VTPAIVLLGDRAAERDWRRVVGLPGAAAMTTNVAAMKAHRAMRRT
jgi:hypothetical protein